MIKPFDIVVAMDQKNGIGKNNQLAWTLPPDMAHFKEITTQTRDPKKINAVVMGRTTWESLPERFRPLPNRLNIVLTTRVDWVLPQGVLLSGNFPEVFERLEARSDVESVFVIGGASVYAQAVKTSACRRIYLTRIFQDFTCDTFFPDDVRLFKTVEESASFFYKDLEYRFVILEQRA